MDLFWILVVYRAYMTDERIDERIVMVSSKGPKTHVGRVPVWMAEKMKRLAAKNKVSVCQLTELAIKQFLQTYERKIK